jgi:hypothetical protein
VVDLRLQGREFAMQHLHAEDEMEQVLRDFIATLSPQERLAGMSTQERLEGLPPEDLLAGLSPETRERLRQLLNEQAQADNSSHPE